jgi:WD40 repeat protein
LAREAAADAREQKRLAAEQEKLAKEAEKEAQKQKEIAAQEQQKAEKAAEDARQQTEAAEKQRRIAIGRRLVNQAKETINDDPKTALMLGLAAEKLQGDTEARSQLTGLVTSIHHAETLSEVTEVVFGSDSVLAARNSNATVSLWNVADRAKPVRLATVGGRKLQVQEVAFHSDGRTLAALTWDDTGPKVILWDVADPTDPIQIATLPRGTVADPFGANGLAFSPDGRTLATTDKGGSGDTIASLWDVTDRTQPKQLSTLPIGNASSWAYEFAFSTDGRTLVTGVSGGAIVWNVADRAHPVRLAKLDSTGGKMAFSLNGAVLATGGIGTVTLWDMKDPTRPSPHATLTGHAELVTSVAFSADGRTLATSDERGTAILWTMTDRDEAVRLDNVNVRSFIDSITLSPDGRTLVTAGESTATLWSVATYGAPQQLTELTGHRIETFEVAFTPDGRSMATADYDGKAIFWDVTNPAGPVRRATVSVHSGPVGAVAFSSDMRTVAAAGLDGRVTLSDVTNPTRPVTLAKFDARVYSPANITISPDGRTLAMDIGVLDHEVGLWDLSNKSRPALLTTFADYGRIVFSPDSRTVAVSETLWDLTNRRAPVRLGSLADPGEHVGPVAFNPDGRTLATGHSGDNASLWDITNRVRPRRLTTLTGRLGSESLAFSSDGRTLATTSSNHQRAILWDVADRANPVRLATLRLPAPYHRSSVFSPDGRTLAFGGGKTREGGTVTLWDYSELTKLRADPAKQACAITGRGLTADEWDRYIPELRHQPTCRG